jgi:hypothetical protein
MEGSGYLYPSTGEDDGSTLAHMEAAVKDGPIDIILGGDLNVDLIHTNTNTQDAEIVATLATLGLDDMGRHFRQRKQYKHRWTWQQT